jgi:hypothetical protein
MPNHLSRLSAASLVVGLSIGMGIAYVRNQPPQEPPRLTRAHVRPFYDAVRAIDTETQQHITPGRFRVLVHDAEQAHKATENAELTATERAIVSSLNDALTLYRESLAWEVPEPLWEQASLHILEAIELMHDAQMDE